MLEPRIGVFKGRERRRSSVFRLRLRNHKFSFLILDARVEEKKRSAFGERKRGRRYGREFCRWVSRPQRVREGRRAADGRERRQRVEWGRRRGGRDDRAWSGAGGGVGETTEGGVGQEAGWERNRGGGVKESKETQTERRQRVGKEKKGVEAKKNTDWVREER